MMALDADTGKEVWQTGYPAAFTMHSAAALHGPGPKSRRSSPTDGSISIGMTGIVTAFDARQRQAGVAEAGLDAGAAVHHACVLADRGSRTRDLSCRRTRRGRAHRVRREYGRREVELERRRSRIRVAGGRGIGGTRQVVTITQGKLVGVDAANGTLLWERPFVITNKTNSVTPVVYGRTIIVSGNGERRVRRRGRWPRRGCHAGREHPGHGDATRDEDGGTRLTLRHENLPSESLREGHDVAWNTYLPRLAVRPRRGPRPRSARLRAGPGAGPDARIGIAARRSGTGLSPRQNALEPRFHGVPAGPAHPDRDADGAGVAELPFSETRRPASAH